MRWTRRKQLLAYTKLEIGRSKRKKKRKKISSLGKLEANSSVWIVYKVGQDG